MSDDKNTRQGNFFVNPCILFSHQTELEPMMPDSDAMANLQTLELLSEVIDRIRERGSSPVTRTTLKRIVSNASNTEFAVDQCIQYGIEEGILSHKGQGYIEVTKAFQNFSVIEEHYYPTVKNTIKALWLDNNYDNSEFIVESTSRKNSKIVGPWTRPDFTLVSHKKFSYTIGHEFDVVTFEVKRPSAANVLAVFEALSHTSAATKAYVVFPLSEEIWIEQAPDQVRRVKDECAKHGVGLILIANPSTKPTPIHLIKARRQQIDHERSSDFLKSVLSAEGKDKIAKWK